jgi:hypothetical protein
VSQSRRGVRALFALVALALTLGGLELLSRPLLALLARDRRFDFTPIAERLAEQSRKLEKILAGGDRLLALDDELGWVYASGSANEGYTMSGQALRGRREYTPKPAPGVLRVAAFGDSFVFGAEVKDDDVWSFQAEQLEPRLEVLNYGIGGYGNDQALLLYRRRGQELAPHVVVLGFPEVDLPRNVNRYRRFLDSRDLPLFKPRFLVDEQGELVLLPNPFPGEAGSRAVLAEPRRALEAGEHDANFEPLEWRNPLYDRSGLARLFCTVATRAWRSRLRPDRLYLGHEMNPESEAFRVLVAIVRTFAREVEAAGDRFLFVIFAVRDEDIWGGSRRAYAPLLEALSGVAIVDLADALAADPSVTPANLREASGHYSPAANRVAARALVSALREQGLLPAP